MKATKDIHNLELGQIDSLISKNRRENTKNGYNTQTHNVDEGKYSKLSLSLTKAEKKSIENYKRIHKKKSISSMIMEILEKEGVLKY